MTFRSAVPRVAHWTSAAFEHLLALQCGREGWGYRRQGPPYTEPTALGCLALLAARTPTRKAPWTSLVHASADWLAGLQSPDGSVGVSQHRPTPSWPTAYAALLWSQLLPAYRSPLARALCWLQQCEGAAATPTEEQVLGRYPANRGWPWVVGHPSWLEPTGLAMLALCRNQLAGHQRIREGSQLILSATHASGGWHRRGGERPAHELPADPAATGIALLALRGAGEIEHQAVTNACDYLSQVLPRNRNVESLAWGLLGWMAWRPAPGDADRWLGECYQAACQLELAPARLALLLLAASPLTLALLGVTTALPPEPVERTFPMLEGYLRIGISE